MPKRKKTSTRRRRVRTTRRTANAGALLVLDRVDRRILIIRGQRVLLDVDLAELYGVSTKALNQAVKRNADRFPADFMFRLNTHERDEAIASRDHLGALRFSSIMPLAFTEQGVAMLSSVLRSKRAAAVNVQVMRAFVRLRQVLTAHQDLARKLDSLERKFDNRTEDHETHIKNIYTLLDQLITPSEPKKRRIGFRAPGAEDIE